MRRDSVLNGHLVGYQVCIEFATKAPREVGSHRKGCHEIRT